MASLWKMIITFITVLMSFNILLLPFKGILKIEERLRLTDKKVKITKRKILSKQSTQPHPREIPNQIIEESLNLAMGKTWKKSLKCPMF